MKKIIQIVLLIFFLQNTNLIYSQKENVLERKREFYLYEIELIDSMFIENLNSLTMLTKYPLLNDKSKTISLSFFKAGVDSVYIIASICSTITFDTKNIGYYMKNKNTYIFSGEVIENIFGLINNKRKFVSKEIIGIKKDDKILPYIEDYIDFEWWFIYTAVALILNISL
ncbi:hypothetical protein AGMMS49965_25610 [Bacteroidia bacterium]|nr:hypothetical protein AGMMS49965_25610 [Bacteroidia bacterium]